MITRKKEFFIGAGLMAGFIIVLIIMFSPVYEQHNGLEYLDDLYNSISKGSAYYIPKIKENIDIFAGTQVSVDLHFPDGVQAEQSALLFLKAGARTNISENRLTVEGDLGKILENCLSDADRMYFNDGQSIADKYGYPERQVLYNWWFSFKEITKALKIQKQFKAEKAVTLAIEKGVECAYNYYQIKPQNISDRVGIVIFSLIFYVLYTLWYGFAIMYMFTGIGLHLDEH